MKIGDFRMSEETLRKFRDTMTHMTPEAREVFMNLLGSVCAEVQIFVMKELLEDLRKGWADTLSTMLLVEKPTRKSS